MRKTQVGAGWTKGPSPGLRGRSAESSTGQRAATSKFPDLVTHIAEVDDMARISAGRLVQQALSLRNWIIGAGIVEFEQSGEDRAAYGDRLLMRLSDALINNGCKGLSARNLKNFRQVAL